MENTKTIQETAMRNSLAARILELRRTKHIWAPGAPCADKRCKRDDIQDVIDSSHGGTTLAELLFMAKRHGFSDLSLLEVRSEEKRVPYEDFTIEVISLYAYRKASDVEYAEMIASIWQEYQIALQEAGDRRAQHEQFLALKAIFEPST